MTDDGEPAKVPVDRDALEALVDTAKGDLERLVTCDGYEKGDDVVDDLVETIDAAESVLDQDDDELLEHDPATIDATILDDQDEAVERE